MTSQFNLECSFSQSKGKVSGVSGYAELELRPGCEFPYRVILILWIKSKQRSNTGYTQWPRGRSKVIFFDGLCGIQGG